MWFSLANRMQEWHSRLGHKKISQLLFTTLSNICFWEDPLRINLLKSDRSKWQRGHTRCYGKTVHKAPRQERASVSVTPAKYLGYPLQSSFQMMPNLAALCLEPNEPREQWAITRNFSLKPLYFRMTYCTIIGNSNTPSS